jgi:DNA-3-methyladenine glycosylase
MNILEESSFNKISRRFYAGADVTAIARNLLGMWLVTSFPDGLTVGRIVETEAYAGITDRASHAWKGRRTDRTEVMYGPPGFAYVYLCYGMHHLFNVVTYSTGHPHAVLIRALEPVQGIDVMAKRTGKGLSDLSITRGPGNLSRAMGIHVGYSGADLLGDTIFLAKGDAAVPEKSILLSPRIGVDYAAEDALLPYRFYLGNNPYVSGKIKARNEKA